MHQTPTAPRTQAPAPMLRRSLRNRHVTMIALGGVIGAGLFAVPMIAGLIVVQLVARGRRRRHLIAR